MCAQSQDLSGTVKISDEEVPRVREEKVVRLQVSEVK